jgi:hypothetical protein
MIKIIWALISLNTLVLLIFIGMYFVINNGKHVSYEEKGWTIILSSAGLILILLAAIPLRLSQSTSTLIFSAVMAALPLLLAVFFSLMK